MIIVTKNQALGTQMKNGTDAEKRTRPKMKTSANVMISVWNGKTAALIIWHLAATNLVLSTKNVSPKKTISAQTQLTKVRMTFKWKLLTRQIFRNYPSYINWWIPQRLPDPFRVYSNNQSIARVRIHCRVHGAFLSFENISQSLHSRYWTFSKPAWYRR